MKSFKLKFPILNILVMTLFLCCMTSCQDEIEMDYNSEDLIDIIENSDSNEAAPQRVIEPILYANFDANLSREEAEAKWTDMVSEFKKKLEPTEKAVSTEWFTSVSTKTGTQTNNGTNRPSYVAIRFLSNIGIINAGYYSLNAIPHTENGSWNYYLFRTDLSNNAVSWLEIQSASLAILAGDPWFVTNLNVTLFSFHQSINASGFAYLFDSPNVWLGNNAIWSHYQTANHITGGRLDF